MDNSMKRITMIDTITFNHTFWKYSKENASCYLWQSPPQWWKQLKKSLPNVVCSLAVSQMHALDCGDHSFMWTSASHISLVNVTANTVSLICRLLIVKIMLDIFELLRRIIHLWPGSNEFLDCVSKIVSFSQRVQLCLSFFTFTIEGLILLKSHERLMTRWQLFSTNFVNDSIHYIRIVLKIYCNNQE